MTTSSLPEVSVRRRSLGAPLLALVTLGAIAALGAAAVSGGSLGPSPTVGAAPAGADGRTIVLFDGRDWSGWVNRSGEPSGWIVEDGWARVSPGGGNAITAAEFGDFQLHLEFVSPEIAGASGQARGNSGVYLHGRYELQVLDSWGDEPLMNGCGAFYSIAPPMVNASRPGDAVQTYDIVFRAPRFDADGAVREHARVTVLHNGIVIHNNLTLPKATPGGVDERVTARGPILLQDHGDPVRYRNIWIRPLD